MVAGGGIGVLLDVAPDGVIDRLVEREHSGLVLEIAEQEVGVGMVAVGQALDSTGVGIRCEVGMGDQVAHRRDHKAGHVLTMIRRGLCLRGCW